ncbi:hypothetical protein Vadar_033722 [Vaccinium darrowii]|uniref:Uncharacterized protein n=1 Tax=Vaccinium darrowii TaxID=229202 RepID=A0ACB7XE43_9ERIC|nr:hypothetical protein Vadar_033722 [Vaccinium darrowii]
MFPWLVMGHLIPYLQLSNMLAQRGHKIHFFIPINTKPKLEHLNLHPNLITFVPFTVPHVEGLPLGAETTNDIASYTLHPLIMTAMDLTRPALEASLKHLKPNFVFFDLAHWVPTLARPLGIKSLRYSVVSPATSSYLVGPARKFHENVTPDDFTKPPLGFPASSMKLSLQEARAILDVMVEKEFGSGIPFVRRILIALIVRKPVILAGPLIPEPPPASTLEERWAKWLNSFKPKAVIFCSFGSECVLGKEQFEELVLGLELTGMPFFAALKPPLGFETIEDSLPGGFFGRTKGRGVVYGDWVQQQLIMGHTSVGCYVTHCGSGSLSEAMVNECELVLMPMVGEKIVNSRFVSRDLEVGVEVERGEGEEFFSRESVCKAIRLVMEVDSEVGKKVRGNNAKWRELLLRKSLDNSDFDSFIQKLKGMLE